MLLSRSPLWLMRMKVHQCEIHTSVHSHGCVHSLSLDSTSNQAYTLSLSSVWPLDCLVFSRKTQHTYKCISQLTQSLSITWLGISWLAWTSSSCLVQRNISAPDILRLLQYLALEFILLSAQSGLMLTSGHPLTRVLSLARLAGTAARRPLCSSSSCWRVSLRTHMQNGEPLIQEQLEIGLNDKTRQTAVIWHKVWILTAVTCCYTVFFTWCGLCRVSVTGVYSFFSPSLIRVLWRNWDVQEGSEI